VQRTIACQLKRFALGADFEGVDAHALFPITPDHSGNLEDSRDLLNLCKRAARGRTNEHAPDQEFAVPKPLLLRSGGAASNSPALRATCAPVLTPISASCAPLLTTRTSRCRGRLGLSLI
jgi:hypothetical protein